MFFCSYKKETVPKRYIVLLVLQVIIFVIITNSKKSPNVKGSFPFLEDFPKISYIDDEAIYDLAKFYFENISLYTDPHILKLLFETDFSKCPTCGGLNKGKLKKSIPSNDIVINFLYGDQIYNVLTYVRSLRSTGCTAKILFFVDDNYTNNFNKEELNMLNECGALLWKIGSLSKKVTDKKISKFLPIIAFLAKFHNHFNRVLICDVFDTFFQMNPFDAKTPDDKVTVTVEKAEMKRSSCNIDWVKDIDTNFTYDYWADKIIINSGVFFGNTEIVIDLFRVIFNPKLFNTNNENEQPILNLIYYKNIFDKIFVDFNAKFFASCTFSIFQLKSDHKGYMHEKLFPENTPCILHQYDRIEPIINNVYKKCPPLGDWHRFPTGRIYQLFQTADGLILNPDEDSIFGGLYLKGDDRWLD